MAKVSIVLPVYKVPEEYLRRCIKSCISQTLDDIEIVIVHDDAMDNCGEICDEYAANDGRIKVVHKHEETNAGLSAARNDGVKVATGEWITFVDGDDWIAPDMCRAMLEKGEECAVQLVMCGVTRDYKQKSVKYSFYMEDGKVYRGDECKWLQQQLLMFRGNIADVYAKFIRRKLLLENEIFHNPMLKHGVEGLEFNLRLFEKVECAVFMDNPYYHYIYNELSLSSALTDETNAYVVKGFEAIKSFIHSSVNAAMLLPWFDNRLLYAVVTTAISGYFSPMNKEPRDVRYRKYDEFLQQSIVADALKTRNFDGIDLQRRIILFFIRHRMYGLLDVMGKMRRWQKKSL